MVECPNCGQEHLKSYLPLKMNIVSRGSGSAHVLYCTNCYVGFWEDGDEVTEGRNKSKGERMAKLQEHLDNQIVCPVCKRKYIPSSPSKEDSNTETGREQHITGICSSSCWKKAAYGGDTE